MDRRKVIKAGSGILAASALGATSLSAKTKKKFRWRLAMSVPKTLPIWGEQVQRFAEQAKKLSGGSLDIRVYGAGELVPAMGVFDAVKAGQIQMGHSASYYWQGKLPASVFFCTVPFGMDAMGMRSWLRYGEGQKLWDELYGSVGMMGLPAGNTGMQMGGWFKKEIKSIKDFSGLKMRIPGLGGKVLAKVGGKPMLVPGGEIFTNLSTGVIDATEWVGPYHDYILGLPKAAKFYYYPGWHEPGATLELMINKKAWQELPEDLQEMIRVLAKEIDGDIHSEWLARDAEYLQKIKSEGKVEFREFPADVLTALHKQSEIVKDEIAATSPLAKKIYASYTKFQKAYDSHYKVSQWAFNKSIYS